MENTDVTPGPATLPAQRPVDAPAKVNNWIAGVHTRWQEITICPAYSRGEAILQRLSGLLTAVSAFTGVGPLGEVLVDTNVPTLGTIMEDLLAPGSARGDYADAENATFSSISRSNLVAALLGAAAGDMNIAGGLRPSYAFAIPSSKVGMGLRTLRTPSRLAGAIPGVLPSPALRAKHDSSWEWSIFPAGCVTEMHCDYHGGYQQILNVTGRKLWLFWPPTARNWSLFAPVRGEANLTTRLMDRLEGMSYLLCDGLMTFTIPPYTLHTVITLTMASHGGTELYHPPSMKDVIPLICQEIAFSKERVIANHNRDEYMEQLTAMEYRKGAWAKAVKTQGDASVREAHKDLLEKLAEFKLLMEAP